MCVFFSLFVDTDRHSGSVRVEAQQFVYLYVKRYCMYEYDIVVDVTRTHEGLPDKVQVWRVWDFQHKKVKREQGKNAREVSQDEKKIARLVG